MALIGKNNTWTKMPLTILLIFLTTFGYFECNVCFAEVQRHPQQTPARTYGGMLNDVSNTIQHANDPESMDFAEYVNDQIVELYMPVRKYLKTKDKFGSGILKTNDYTQLLVNKERTAEENEPFVLYRILEALEKVGENSNVTSACINDTGRLIVRLLTSNDSWPGQFFDACGKPGPSIKELRLNFVGNWEQCRSARAPAVGNGTNGEKRDGFHGNYCVVGLAISPVAQAAIGTCFPSTCSSDQVSSLAREILILSKAKLPPQLVFAECRTAPTEMTGAAIAAILLLSIIGTLMILGTVYDVFVLMTSSKPTEKEFTNHASNSGTANDYGSLSQSGNESRSRNPINQESASLLPSSDSRKVSLKHNPSNLGVKILLAFSVYSNGKKLLNTSQPPGALQSIHGIRFLSMSWVLLCHVYAFCLSFTVNGTESFPDMFRRWTFLPIANGFVSVDSFFTLSGLLTAYLTTKEMMRRNTWKINWPMFYFHRFWRLTPPYMFAIVISLGLTQFAGQGPLWNNKQPGDKDACETNWWTNLLYINNLVGTDLACFGHSWYLANDMQFFVLSPLLLIPFYFHVFAGFVSCGGLLLIHWIVTGVLSTEHKWPTTTTSLQPVPGRASQVEWFNHYYIVPWCRIGPFIVGIMAGYVLARTKGRPFRLPSWLVATGWILAVTSGLAVVYGIRGDITGDNPSTLQAAALYNAVNRSVWGACVAWVIIACSAGYGGPVNALLSWSPFVVLGRLTYMTYLIHLSLGAIYYENLGALIYFNDTTMVLVFTGLLVVANMVAFVLVLVLESPMVGLERTFIRKERKE